MTTTERPPSDDVVTETAATDTGTAPRRTVRGGDRPTASQRAYERRRRREQSMLDARLTAVGRPIRASLGKVPVVLAAIVLLGGGIAGVLTINTMADEIGLQTTRTAAANEDLQLRVQALQQAVADADSTPRIAQQARRLGMGPADDPAIITIDGKGRSTLIGTPTPQASQLPAAPPAPPTSSAAPAPTTPPATSAAGSSPARTSSAPTSPAPTSPAPTSPAVAASSPPAVTTATQTKTAQTSQHRSAARSTAGGNR